MIFFLSGSYTKGTAVKGGSDIDLFISLKSEYEENLFNIYNTFYDFLVQSRYKEIRKQNVSIGMDVNHFKIDLVPGRKQNEYDQDHSLYKHKTNSWTKTNIKTHIDLVRNSNCILEIRAIKV